MSYTILAFPELRDFLKHLKGRGINEFGKILRQHIKSGRDRTPVVTLIVRLSAKDEVRHEIIRCDLEIHNDIYTTAEILKKETEEVRQKIDKWIKKVVKEEEAKDGIPFNQLSAEFQPVQETTER